MNIYSKSANILKIAQREDHLIPLEIILKISQREDLLIAVEDILKIKLGEDILRPKLLLFQCQESL